MPQRYEQISRVEREKIAIGVRQGWSYRQIGGEVGRAGSTIWREVKRNSGVSGFYGSVRAHQRAMERRRKPRRECKLSYRPLRVLVEDRLRRSWSPDQISGRQRYHDERREDLQVCGMTIYRHINRDRPPYQPYLRGPDPGQRKRRCRHQRIRDRRMIGERPSEVEARCRVGHWESDTIRGPKKSEACVVTHLERKTYYLVARLLKQCQAEPLNAATAAAMSHLPVETLTVDNGMEFGGFKKLEKKLNARVYFAHEKCPWERARNEHANGLLRQFFPRGTDFATVSAAQLGRAVRSLNERPRKALGYKTPKEVMQELRVAVVS